MSDERQPAVAGELVDPVEPLIQSLPTEKKVLLRQIIAQYQGPLPPPSMMEEYGRVIPDGANRLMNLLEKQTDHRIAMEDRLITGELSVTRRGQYIAFTLSVFFGLVAAFLGHHNHDVLAGAIGVTTIIGLAVVFVLGREPGQNEAEPSSKEDVPEPKRPPNQSPRKKKS